LIVRRRLRAKTIALLAVVLVVLAAGASAVRAELTASGNLFITFDGGISPNSLPRLERGPITVFMSGTVRTLKGEHPPALSMITIALNKDGHLETRGLPTCKRRILELSSTQEALEKCRSALVGRGKYRARTDFPEQARSPSHGTILAFNGEVGGQSVILAHVHGDQPTWSTNIIVFHIRHTSGTYGTELVGAFPPGLTRWGYLKRISLSLHRIYTYRGRTLSYLSAPCRAPEGLREASFPFVYTSMTFADGRVLSANLTRTCKVKGGT
jgi:hypothetical protein